MSSPPFKRRRIDKLASSNSLAKPFKSPLIVNKNGANLSERADGPSSPPKEQNPLSSPAAKCKSSPLKINSSPRTPRRKFAIYGSIPPPDSPMGQLFKEQRILERQIRTSRQQLDTLGQARRIKQKQEDEALEELCVKWKSVSRAAAEAIFETVKAKVESMGGVGAWREWEKRRGGWNQSGFDEPEKSHFDDDNDPFRDTATETKSPTADNGISPNKRQGNGVVDQAEETFTMDMMLKSLNIDLKLVGYDKVDQRWSD